MDQQEKKQDKVKITMLVNENTRKTWKQYSLDTDRTLTEVIKDAMREYMTQHPAK